MSKENENEKQEPQVQVVQPSPVPTTYQIAEVADQNTGKKFTMLTISTPTGRSVYFLDSTLANTVGEALIKAAANTVDSGLIVPQLA